MICTECFTTHRLSTLCGEDPKVLADEWREQTKFFLAVAELSAATEWVLGFASVPEERLTDEQCKWFEYLTRLNELVPEAAAAFEKQTKASEPEPTVGSHVGTLKTRCPFTVTVAEVADLGVHETYGQRFLCLMTDRSGSELVWFTGENLTLEVGVVYNVVARVEEHGVFNGRKQTRVSRLKEVK